VEDGKIKERFEEIKRDVILPTLRTLMVDLDRKGHLTRLWEKTPERIRFDIQVQTRSPKRGAIELSLHATEPKLKIDYGWNSGTREQELHPLEAIQAPFVTERVLYLLRGLG
jgi:hypothetical protein